MMMAGGEIHIDLGARRFFIIFFSGHQ